MNVTTESDWYKHYTLEQIQLVAGRQTGSSMLPVLSHSNEQHQFFTGCHVSHPGMFPLKLRTLVPRETFQNLKDILLYSDHSYPDRMSSQQQKINTFLMAVVYVSASPLTQTSLSVILNHLHMFQLQAESLECSTLQQIKTQDFFSELNTWKHETINRMNTYNLL